MAHKTLIDGTAYEVNGGKTFIGGVTYEIDKGNALVDGTAYEIGFGGWPDDLDTALEFVSASPFTLSARASTWNGRLEYSNGNPWAVWEGEDVLSGSRNNGQCIYIRGIGNTCIGGRPGGLFNLSGYDIECNGNIENLLDYTIVKAGGSPTMADSCYSYIFRNCPGLITAPTLPATTLTKGCYEFMFQECVYLTTAPALPATTLADNCYSNMFADCYDLTTAPSLPATTLAQSCYESMFKGCFSLTTIPALPATTLVDYCYYHMFSECPEIKLSTSQTGKYTKAYRIPISGSAHRLADHAATNMFEHTGGTFTGTPVINKTYYLDESNIIV